MGLKANTNFFIYFQLLIKRMACIGCNCPPLPPREWYRFQNRCPNPEEPDAVDATKYAMLKKGNILQYKANSSNLTKNQKYAQMAKGMWTNRTTTWASQSQTVTNPNSLSLARVGFSGDIVPCSKFVPTVPPPSLPSTEDVAPSDSIILPPPPPSSGPVGPQLPLVPVEAVRILETIVTGGTLVCGTYHNVCSGVTRVDPFEPLCYPTTDSDVPGPIQNLCYDDSLPTWYPRQRRTYATSGNKWPTNSKFIG